MPQQNAIRTAQIWGPVLQHLQKVTGHQFELKTNKDIPAFEAALARGEYDFAYMNPYHYTVFSERAGYQALAHRAGNGIRGVVVVAKDSDIRALSELDGRVVGFPAPAAFAATLINQAEMKAEGAQVIPKYTSSHDSVYRAVASGLLEAGGGIGRTLKATDPKVSQALRVLHTTQEYTPHAIAASARIPVEVQNAIQQAFIGLSEPAVLDALKVQGFVPASDQDWDDVRALKLQVIR
ncbi:MAG: phosphate/phosphite/phosphonate ABC transporter substrate-binding protein [Litorivicinus sp.]